MMKTLFLLACSLLLALATTVSAVAKEKPKVIQRTGEVVTIDVAAKSMTLKYKTDTIIITLTDTTLVKMNRERKALHDIKIGDRVTVWFFEKDKAAKSIDIKPAPVPSGQK
jgi:Cu/Ag efflux protein CusF